MSLRRLRSLVANDQLEEAKRLHESLLFTYRDSPSLMAALGQIDDGFGKKTRGDDDKPRDKSTTSIVVGHGSKKSARHKYNRSLVGPYKNIELSTALASLLVKASNHSVFSVSPPHLEINIVEGGCLLPIQSVISGRIHFFIKDKLNASLSICYSPPSSLTKMSRVEEVRWIQQDKEFVADINPDKGQAWLRILKDKEERNSRIQFASARLRRSLLPTVLVIIPFYNDEEFLPDAISSIKEQTYEGEISVVVVDDFSDEKSAQEANSIINAFENELDVNIVHHESNKRLSEARNTGFNSNKADLVQLLDADDLLHVACIKQKVEAFLDDTNPLCIGSYSRINLVQHDTKLEKIRGDLVQSPLERMTLLNTFGRCPTNCHGPLMSFRHYYALGLFSPSVNRGAEDYDFWLRLLTLGFELKEVPYVLGYYRMKESGSMSRDDVSPHYLESVRIIHEAYKNPIFDFLGTKFIDWPYRLTSGLSDLYYSRQVAERYIRFLVLDACNQILKRESKDVVVAERLEEHPFAIPAFGYHSICAVGKHLYYQFTNVDLIISMNVKRSQAWSNAGNEDIRKKVFHGVYEKVYNLRFESGNTKDSCSAEICVDNILPPELRKLESTDGTDADEMKFYSNRYEGKRCFVIGNGPSLNKHDLDLLANEYSFGVNGIFYKTDECGFAPTFYVVEDNMVMKENIERIRAYRPLIRKFFPSDYRKLHPKDGKTTFFTMNRAFYTKNSAYYEKPQFSRDASNRLFCGQSVTIINLQLAFYMGFTDVYLIGMDFNYNVNKDTQEIQENAVHILSKGDDENHFHPDYFGKGKTWKDPKLHNVEASYRKCRDEYEKHGRKIYNASYGGRLEVFERVNYDSLF